MSYRYIHRFRRIGVFWMLRLNPNPDHNCPKNRSLQRVTRSPTNELDCIATSTSTTTNKKKQQKQTIPHPQNKKPFKTNRPLQQAAKLICEMGNHNYRNKQQKQTLTHPTKPETNQLPKPTGLAKGSHFVLKSSNYRESVDTDMYSTCIFGIGCFYLESWFIKLPGVYTTCVGYIGGSIENPSFEQVCSNTTGHLQAIKVVWSPKLIHFSDILRMFWTTHDPTNLKYVGSPYSSRIIPSSRTHYDIAVQSRNAVQNIFGRYNKNVNTIISEPVTGTHIDQVNNVFYYAEDKHQQFLAKTEESYLRYVENELFTYPFPSIRIWSPEHAQENRHREILEQSWWIENGWK